MKTYIFKTTTTMKEYNSKHWWIDGNIVPEKTITAESVAAALEEYRELVEYDNCISISRNAIKARRPMYVDLKTGGEKQAEPGFWDCYELAASHGCELWTCEEV